MIKSLSTTNNAPADIHKTAKNKMRNILKSLNENPNQPRVQERLDFWKSK